MIRVRTPFDRDKNLGRAYNSEFENCPDGDWLCFIDHDCCFLTPNAIEIMYQYTEKFPDTGIFTALTNRIHPLAVNQNYFGTPSSDFDMRAWGQRARTQALKKTEVTELKHPISGFLMLISKETWKEIKFTENGKALGVDNDFSGMVLLSGKKIYRMDRILVWHSYRMEDIKNKSHLI